MFLDRLTVNEKILEKYLFYYFKFFGIACMTVKSRFNEKTKIHQHLFIPSKLGVAYNVCFFLYVVTSTCFGLEVLYEYYYQKTVTFDQYYNLFMDSLTLGISLNVILKFAFNQRKTIEIANELYRINESIIALNDKLHRENPICKDILVMFSFFSLIWSVKLISFYLDSEKHIIFIGVLPIYTTGLVVTTLIMQYCTILKFLERLFRVINDELMEITKEPITHIHVYHRQVQSKSALVEVEKLLQTRRLYIDLCNISQTISKFYSLPMMLCILNFFGAIICSVYYVSKPIALGKVGLPTSLYIGGLSYGIVYGSLLVALTQCVTSTTSESKRTGEIVNQCLMNCENHRTAEKLNQFSNYLMHAKVEFTVFKLFSLDQSLLMSVLGATTTYLVIILQFQQPI